MRSTNIGLWGATASGKTVLLANLSRAALRLHPSMGKWQIEPADDYTMKWVAAREEELARGMLPGPTQASDGVSVLRFDLIMREPPPGASRRLRRSQKDDENIKTTLVVPDPSGQIFREPSAEDTGTLFVTSHFKNSDAIIYLFDPDREAKAQAANHDGQARTNVEYLRHFLMLLRFDALRGNTERTGILDQLLAVCVTKFDMSAVYDEAVDGRWVTEDDIEPFAPRVPDSLARNYFHWLCRDKPDARDVIAEIETSFATEDKIRYFVTSSLGFIKSANGFRSAIEGGPGGRVSNQGSPVNVLEPIVQLVYRHKTKRWIPSD